MIEYDPFYLEHDNEVLSEYTYQCPHCNGIRTSDKPSRNCDESCGDLLCEQYELPRHEELNFNR